MAQLNGAPCAAFARAAAQKNAPPMRVCFCQTNPALRKSGAGNLYVSGLAPLVDNAVLGAAFAPFGAVASAAVALDAHGGSKGYGFVQFVNPNDAAAATAAMNGAVRAPPSLPPKGPPFFLTFPISPPHSPKPRAARGGPARVCGPVPAPAAPRGGRAAV